MNVSINIDCTPQEARTFLGLPDMTQVHDQYVQAMVKAVETAGSAEQMQSLLNSFSPMGQAGMDMFKRMMDFGASATGGGSKG